MVKKHIHCATEEKEEVERLIRSEKGERKIRENGPQGLCCLIGEFYSRDLHVVLTQ
jgi:hypothetical protein